MTLKQLVKLKSWEYHPLAGDHPNERIEGQVKLILPNLKNEHKVKLSEVEA